MKTLDDIRPGQTIGRYEFLVPIARGGMAAVWAARLKGSRGFSKTVAIKTMLPSLSDDPLFEQMFLDEAQIAAQIRHPNVVEIMDLGEEQDVLYIVMEYIDGESVATILRAANKRDKVPPLPIAVHLAIDACNGMHAAHELRNVDGNNVGLVHRDISPQNILVTHDGMVKLVDFGVAKAAGRTSSDTTAGQIKGKAPYMAPEQAMGMSVDRRTDIFAMGIVLYQITTGKHPFRGENDVATLHNILHRTVPSPRFVDPKFPRPLEFAIMKSLAREPEKRFQTAADMATALDRVFPPVVRRAGTADVARFVKELLGDVGDRRREALREAIRAADLRAASPSAVSVAVPVALSEVETGLSSPTQQRVLSAQTEQIAAVSADRASHPNLGSGQRAALPDVITSSGVSASTSSPVISAIGPEAPARAAPAPTTGAEPDLGLPKKSRAGAASGVVFVVIAIGALAVFGTKYVRARRAHFAAPRPPVSEPFVAAPTASATASVASARPMPTSSAPDLDAVSHPVPGAPWPPVADPGGLGTRPPHDGKGKPDKPGAKPDAGGASATPGWKPPPVADPGF